MQQGITVLFNNFNQISNELLVSLVSLSKEGIITNQQKEVKASAGFKIIGILSGKKQNKSKNTIGKLVRHYQLAHKSVLSILPIIEHQQNREYL